MQQLQQQLAQQRAAEITQEAAAAAEISKGLQLKWAEKAAPAMVKSLAQIQQEEQERLAKVKVVVGTDFFHFFQNLFELYRIELNELRVSAARKRKTGKGRPQGTRRSASERWNLGNGCAISKLDERFKCE